MLSSHVSLFSLFPRSQRAAADAAVAEDSSSCTVIRKSRAVKCWCAGVAYGELCTQLQGSLSISRVSEQCCLLLGCQCLLIMQHCQLCSLVWSVSATASHNA